MKLPNSILLKSLYCLTIFFVSCSNSPQKIEFSHKKVLQSDTVFIEQIFNRHFIHVLDDYLLISGPDTCGLMLHVYSTPELDYKESFIHKGRANNEVVASLSFCSSYLYKNSVFLEGFANASLQKAEITNKGKHCLLENVKIGYIPDTRNNTHFLENKYLLYYNSRNRIIKYDITSKEIIAKAMLNDNNEKGKYLGWLSANNKYAVFVYNNKNQIDIYNANNLNLHTTIIGKKVTDNLQYSSVLAGEERFFVVNPSGDYIDGDNTFTTVDVFDYNGVPIIQYQLKSSVKVCRIDEKKGYIYAHEVSDDKQYFLKFKL